MDRWLALKQNKQFVLNLNLYLVFRIDLLKTVRIFQEDKLKAQ